VLAPQEPAYRVVRARQEITEARPVQFEQARVTPHRGEREALPVIGTKMSIVRVAEVNRLVEHRIEHRCEVAGRGIDDLQYLGGCGLPLQGLIALGKGLIEPPLQVSVGAPKLGYFVIERRGHVLLRRALLPTG